jgi:uncharacterized membrane protein
MDTTLVLVFRFLHVIAGGFWFGAALFFFLFIKPTVKDVGPAGPQFMQVLATRRRFPIVMVLISTVTIFSGIALYHFTSGGFNSNWITSGPGIGFTIGSIAGIIAFLVGNIVIGPTTGKMSALGQQIATAGGPPSSEQMSQMHSLEAKLSQGENLDFVFLTISMITMATARYWIF